RNQAERARSGQFSDRPLRLGPPRGGVVVGERDRVEPRGERGRHQLRRGVSPVGLRGMRVQVKSHTDSGPGVANRRLVRQTLPPDQALALTARRCPRAARRALSMVNRSCWAFLSPKTSSEIASSTSSGFGTYSIRFSAWI